MKTLWLSVAAAALALGSTPTLADEAWQVFECQLTLDDAGEEKTGDDVIAAAEKWLAAARTMPGGEEMELRIMIPHAAMSGDTDFFFVMTMPSFAAWGTFWDNYEGSPAHDVDEASDEITNCPSSRLYENVPISLD